MSPLIEIDDSVLRQPDTILIDARGGADSYPRYLAGHLKNAIYADLDKHLAARTTDPSVGGRHPLPDIKSFGALLGSWGITPESHIVIYDDKSAANSAARLWWMLRAIGHQKVQCLNGGLQAAIRASVHLSTEANIPLPVGPYPVPDEYKGTADIEETGAAAQDTRRIVIDVRETPRYLGQTEPLDLVAGHIPGADNLPYAKNLAADGRYLPAEELRKNYEAFLGDIKPESVIVHCGSGVTACHTLLALEYAGMGGSRLYVGSWSEWSRSGRPMNKEEK